MLSATEPESSSTPVDAEKWVRFIFCPNIDYRQAEGAKKENVAETHDRQTLFLSSIIHRFVRLF